MRSSATRGILAVFALAAFGASALGQAAPKVLKTAPPEQQKLVVEAGETWDRFQSDPDMTWFREHDKDAVGFLISPKVVKAGFIFGDRVAAPSSSRRARRAGRARSSIAWARQASDSRPAWTSRRSSRSP